MSTKNHQKKFKRDIPPLKMHDVGNAQLPYLYYEGEPPQILFAHATGFLPWLWHPIIEELAPHHQAWAPYICNYRDCDPERGLGWDMIARDLISFCSSQNILDNLAVGHSMGATVLTIASALFGLQPRGMILIEPIFLPEEFYLMDIKLKDHPLASQSIIADYGQKLTMYKLHLGYTYDGFKTIFSPSFIHVYNNWGDETWDIWQSVIQLGKKICVLK